MTRTRDIFRRIAFCFCMAVALCSVSYGLDSDPPAVAAKLSADVPSSALPDDPAPQIPVTEKGLPLAILKDQIPIWTSPVRIRAHDLIWLLPLGAATGLTLATDTNAMRTLSRDRTVNKDCVNASDYLRADWVIRRWTLQD
jgi:hypothetical protein